MSEYIILREWRPDEFQKAWGADKSYKRQKTKRFNVINKKHGNILGIIKWSNGWRQYCFYPEEDTVWSEDCMNRVGYWIWELNKEHKKGWKK